MVVQEQRFFLITATRWDPSSRANDRGARCSADPHLRSCQVDKRSGKYVYVCFIITFLHYILAYRHELIHFARMYILLNCINSWKSWKSSLLFAAELSINICSAMSQICASSVRLNVVMWRLQDSAQYMHTWKWRNNHWQVLRPVPCMDITNSIHI